MAFRRAVCGAGAIAVSATIFSPAFDALTDASFAWHMVQHLALLFAVAPLVLLADPFAAVRAIAGRRTASIARATRWSHVAFHPAVAFAVYVGALWAVHFSPLFEASLESTLPHVAEHAAFMLAGFAYWAPLIAPHPLRPLPYPARVLYALVLLPQGAFVSAVIDSARTPLYAHYAHVLGASALGDQQNAAAVMWIAGGIIGVGALLAVAGVWARRERRALAFRASAIVFFCAAVATATIAARADGAALYATSCASCHGERGQGSRSGPPLVGSSATMLHFMLDTGRMPASSANVNELHERTRFSDAQIRALVDYVLTFSAHPDRALPAIGPGDPIRGRTLFAQNCAQCHGASARGASVGADNVAPSLMSATAVQVAEAIRAGPGVMPRFGRDVLSDRDVDDVARFVGDLQTRGDGANAEDAGGFSLGHYGPVAEGLVAWLFGIGALVLFVRAVGSR